MGRTTSVWLAVAPDGCRGGGVVPGVEGDDRLVKATRSDESVKETRSAKILEGGRKKLGGIVKRTPLEAYKRLWDQVQDMHKIGMDPTTIDTVIGDSDLAEDAKKRMRDNLAALPD